MINLSENYADTISGSMPIIAVINLSKNYADTINGSMPNTVVHDQALNTMRLRPGFYVGKGSTSAERVAPHEDVLLHAVVLSVAIADHWCLTRQE